MILILCCSANLLIAAVLYAHIPTPGNLANMVCAAVVVVVAFMVQVMKSIREAK